MFYKGSDACVFVFDLTKNESLLSLSKWKEEFFSHVHLSNSACILVGNKNDLIVEREVTKKEALEWCKQNGVLKYYEVSAKTANTVKEVFEDVAAKVAKSKEKQLYYST